jgi:hypothetical protein
MCLSSGLNSPIDTGLYNMIKAQFANSSDEYNLSCLLIVLFAISLARLTRYESSQYRPDLQANCNNAHCLPYTICTLASCFFYEVGASQQIKIAERLTEFLALASSALLKLIYETNDKNSSSSSSQKEVVNREAVYIILDQVTITLQAISLCIQIQITYNLPYFRSFNQHHI